MRHPQFPPARAFLLVLVAVLAVSAVRVDPAGSFLHAEATQVLVLHPDGVNGTDTFIQSGMPLWNFGNNASLDAGPNPISGILARSLLRFNLARLPSNATIANATLSLYETQGTGGTVLARPALAPWTEGTGNRSWTRVPLVVRETAGVNRTLEPVGVTIMFQPNAGVDPLRDLRVWNGANEVPSQVYGDTYSGGQIASTQVWFDVTLGAHSAKWFNITYAANDTGIPAYRTATWGAQPGWIYGPTGGGASGATVADLFGDGKLEVLFGGTDGYVYCVNATGILVWRRQVSPTGKSVPFTPQVADMNRSGQPSIVVVTDDPSVVRLDRDGNVVWRYNSSTTLFTSATLADVNHDGVLDVLFGGKFVDAVDGRDGTLLRQYPVGLAGYTTAVGNVSGQDMIYFPGDDKNVHAYTFAGTQLWSAAAPGASFLEGSIGLGDVNGDGVPDVVTGDNGNNGILFALNATDGTTLWSNATATYREGGQTLADLNGDGRLEVLFGTTAGTIYSLRGTNGYTVWSYPTGTPVLSTPAVSDLDASGSVDVTIIVGTSVLVLGPTGSLLHSWTIAANNQNLRSSSEYPMTSPAIADLAGNGSLEVLVPTGSGMAMFPTGGLYHDWRTWGYDGNHTNLAFDGNSPDRAPFLQAVLGAPQSYPAAGASWNYRDGVSTWTTRGGDFGPPVSNATGSPGWMRWNLTSLVQDWVAGRASNLGLFLTEAAEISGPLHTFVSGDGPTAPMRPALTIEWAYPSPPSPGSGPEIVGRIPDQVNAENGPPWTLDLEGYARDNTTPLSQLRWNITGLDPAVVQVYGLNELGNHNLTFAPTSGRSGAFRVTYWLTDVADRFASQTAWVNVTPIALPPFFTPPPTFYVHANQTYRFDFGPYISDPDTPRAQLTLVSDDPVDAPISGFNVSFLYPTTRLDQWVFVNLTVSDGPHAVSRVVSVKVTNDQPPYVRAALPDETLNQDERRQDVFNVNGAFATLEPSPLVYTVGSSRTGVTIHANGSVDLQAPLDWWGVEGVTFRATDPVGAFAEDTILVTVIHLDARPVFGPVPDLRVHFDAPYFFNLDPYLSDPDTPMSGLVVTSSDVHVGVSGHYLNILYPVAFNDTVQNVTLTVSDGILASSRAIHVAIGSDWPPRVSNLPDARFYENSVVRGAYNLSRDFSDPEGSMLYWSSGNRSVLVTIHANGSVDLAARPNWWGVERVTFRATDPQGALAEDCVWITVLRVDDPPYFLPIPQQRLNATTAYLPLTPYLRDPDDAASNLSLLGTNSTHATVVGQGILFSFARDTEDWIQVTVSDGNLTNTTTILVIVSLPPASVREVVPGWILWLPPPLAAVAATVFVVYRRRKLEWAFLVTIDGLLVSSVSRRGPGDLDTDLVTGMLTTIMDFAKRSFSDEKERNLEGLQMGDKRVAITRGDRAYLAVVYRGRTPGRLLPIMRSLLEKIEKEHRDALGEIVDTSKLANVPLLLEKLVTRGNLPFVSFGAVAPAPR